MKLLGNLFENNRLWADSIKKIHPDFFRKLSEQQAPEYLWIGCSDSRVPANEIVGLMPGEIFVHRNVANVVVHTDMNCLSVLQYAIDVLKVKHIMVVGHYGCGGVRAAMGNQALGLIDNWLRNIKDIYRQHRDKIDAIQDEEQRVNLLCELNVVEQVNNVCHTTIVQDAWARGQALAVHGWIYSIRNGGLKDLNVCVTCPEQLDDIYRIESELQGEEVSRADQGD
jgi:carbonic anhydrase